MLVKVVFSMMLADRSIDDFLQRDGTVSETTLGCFSGFARGSGDILSCVASPHDHRSYRIYPDIALPSLGPRPQLYGERMCQ
jgi:hypothetical protein